MNVSNASAMNNTYGITDSIAESMAQFEAKEPTLKQDLSTISTGGDMPDITAADLQNADPSATDISTTISNATDTDANIITDNQIDATLVIDASFPVISPDLVQLSYDNGYKQGQIDLSNQISQLLVAPQIADNDNDSAIIGEVPTTDNVTLIDDSSLTVTGECANQQIG